jgi:Leucine Rich repeat
MPRPAVPAGRGDDTATPLGDAREELQIREADALRRGVWQAPRIVARGPAWAGSARVWEEEEEEGDHDSSSETEVVRDYARDADFLLGVMPDEEDFGVGRDDSERRRRARAKRTFRRHNLAASSARVAALALTGTRAAESLRVFLGGGCEPATRHAMDTTRFRSHLLPTSKARPGELQALKQFSEASVQPKQRDRTGHTSSEIKRTGDKRDFSGRDRGAFFIRRRRAWALPLGDSACAQLCGGLMGHGVRRLEHIEFVSCGFGRLATAKLRSCLIRMCGRWQGYAEFSRSEVLKRSEEPAPWVVAPGNLGEVPEGQHSLGNGAGKRAWARRVVVLADDSSGDEESPYQSSDDEDGEIRKSDVHLRRTGALSTLILSDNDLDAECAVMVADVLAAQRDQALAVQQQMPAGSWMDRLRFWQPTCLSKLVLDYSFVGDHGAIALGTSLENHPGLLELDLAHAHIGSIGTGILFKSLSKNAKLTRLVLSGNDVDDDSATAAGRCLRKNSVLLELELEHCHIGDSQCSRFALGLAANIALHSLLIGFNTIENVGAVDLSAALSQNDSLAFLDLTGNSIDDGGAVELVATFETSAMQSLLLDGNEVSQEIMDVINLKSSEMATLMSATASTLRQDKTIDDGGEKLADELLVELAERPCLVVAPVLGWDGGPNQVKESFLRLAARANYPAVIDTLLKFAAAGRSDWTRRLRLSVNGNGESALDIARRHWNLEAVHALEGFVRRRAGVVFSWESAGIPLSLDNIRSIAMLID